MIRSMTNDDEHAQHEQQGHVHLHRAALSDEWQRLRLTLTMLHVAMQGDWPDTLTQELANHALLHATVMCSIEVTQGDDW